MRLTRSVLVTVLVIPWLSIGLPQRASAEMYSWIDEKGNMHATSNLAEVPAQYRRAATQRAASAEESRAGEENPCDRVPGLRRNDRDRLRPEVCREMLARNAREALEQRAYQQRQALDDLELESHQGSATHRARMDALRRQQSLKEAQAQAIRCDRVTAGEFYRRAGVSSSGQPALPALVRDCGDRDAALKAARESETRAKQDIEKVREDCMRDPNCRPAELMD